ncbi:MAG: restriction endonuclease subunit S [Nitrospira sp.]|nr:restriction endonuclease subunit S [Nitrospira sp.]
MSWKVSRLGDVVTLKRGHDLPDSQRQDGDIPVVSSSGVTGRHAEAKAKAPGVVTGRYGTLGEVFYIEEDYWPLNTALYVTDFKGNHPRFVAYFLQDVLRNCQSDKAAVPGVNRNVLHEFKVRYPDTKVQERIGEILYTYDDLIENNRRRMVLLEEAARQLYREWFIRLRFPGHEHTRITNGMPEGWRKVRLGAITIKIGSGFTPRGGESSYLVQGVPLIRSQNVHDDLFQDDGLAFVSEAHASDLAGVTVESKDILLNITGASVARCCMAPERYLPARVNQHVMIIRVDPEKADPFLVQKAITSDERKRQLLSYAQKGSTREALTKEMIANFEIVLPAEALMWQFGEMASTSFRQREVLALQNQKLRAARDLLLPRLMSGEITV